MHTEGERNEGIKRGGDSVGKGNKTEGRKGW